MRTLDPVRHAEKRQEILAAAARCIGRDGFQGASTGDICKEAGISPGHLYHYFENKEAILTAFAEDGAGRLAARFQEMMAGDDAIGALIAQVGKQKGTKRDPQRRAMGRLVLEMLMEAGRNAAIARIVRKNSQLLRGLLTDFIKEGQHRGQIDSGLDAGAAASLLLSMRDGMLMLAIRDPEADMGQILETMQVLIGRFLAAPKR